MEIVRPEDVGLSSERLARIERHLERRYLDQKKIAGALTLVARRGRVAHFSSLGMMDLERGKPMREDTIFRIYSMSKPITSVALMTLYEHGRFQLDDAVHKYIPAFRDLRVYEAGNHPTFATRPVERSMTIRDLLTHTSGLTYGFMERTNVDRAYRRLGIGDRSSTLAEMMEKLGKLPLEFSPGTKWNYSVSTDVVAHLVERISGRRFDTFVRDEITGPLGMSDTGFHVPDDKASRFAQCYQRSAGGGLEQVKGRTFREPPSAPSGGGGLVSTATDYMRFCEAMRQGGALGDVRLLGPKTVRLMRSNHLPNGRELADVSVSMFSEAIYRGVGFGLGFAMTTDVRSTQIAGSLGEFWWGGAASTAFWIDPVEDVCVVLLTQFMPSNVYPIRRELRTLINAAILESRD